MAHQTKALSSRCMMENYHSFAGVKSHIGAKYHKKMSGGERDERGWKYNLFNVCAIIILYTIYYAPDITGKWENVCCIFSIGSYCVTC